MFSSFSQCSDQYTSYTSATRTLPMLRARTFPCCVHRTLPMLHAQNTSHAACTEHLQPVTMQSGHSKAGIRSPTLDKLRLTYHGKLRLTYPGQAIDTTNLSWTSYRYD